MSQAKKFASQADMEEKKITFSQISEHAWAYTAEGDPNTGVIVGVRRDEDPTRAKERYFSPRDKNMEWNVEDQPPELWDQFKTDYEKGAHIRIHPLLHWTELNIWEYIHRENIPIIPLYFANEKGERYQLQYDANERLCEIPLSTEEVESIAVNACKYPIELTEGPAALFTPG